MSKNMGTADRAIRIVIALVLLYLAFATSVAATGLVHWLAIIVAVVFIVTSIVGMCPLYSVIGLKTCRSR
ncbi:MAG: bifunctional protein GlmU [Rhodobacteraceae bacterium]|nr:bifunctional protein GlmU [Paracoccaceae bacterium]